jgi:hypothetical protein
MMVMGTSTLTDLDFSQDWYFSYLMTSFNQRTFGEYAVVFHVGVSGPQATTQTSPTPGAPNVAGVGRGVEVVCPDGTPITNAIEVIINMRPGFTYTATALGIDGYDPVIAVGDETGIVLCEDDTSDAAGYSVTLPTTGTVRASALSPQQPFRHNYEGFADISIIVGGFAGQSGEFVLVLEGMAVTASDGTGDPFVVRISENMAYGQNDLAVYMMASSRGLDALVRLVDEDDEVLAECDDGGNTAVCDGTSFDLGTSSVTTISGTTPTLSTNPMLIFPTTTLTDLDWTRNYFLTFLMSSFGGSAGNYVIAFHFSTGAAPEGTAPATPNTPVAPGGTETPPNTDL